jgi:hypothetical protein
MCGMQAQGASLTYSQSLFQNGASSQDINHARRVALRTRSSVACNQCRAAKARCNDYRPCGRCIQNGEADACKVELRERKIPKVYIHTHLALFVYACILTLWHTGRTATHVTEPQNKIAPKSHRPYQHEFSRRYFFASHRK